MLISYHLREKQDAERIAELEAKVGRLKGVLAEEHHLCALAVVALSPLAAQHQGKVRARDFAFFADSCPTCAALESEKPPEPARWHEGMRQYQPGTCWLYVAENTVCILERGHDAGKHEPPEERG